MGKSKKGRSVKKNSHTQNVESEEHLNAPHSFVIHRGLPGDHIVDLTHDFRRVMEPYTASTLKERKKNSIKDFVSIAGHFHVSHLCMFSRTETGMYLKLGRIPRGPTLSFKVINFTLSRDVVSSLKKQLVVGEAYKTFPLVVLNNFSGEGVQMKLMATMFQNMFPKLNLTGIKLSSVRRCVLMNYNSTNKTIDFRHYAIKVLPVGISKGVKKVVQGKVPNLSRFSDISEFLTKSGMLSESEAEEDPNHHVMLPQKIESRGNIENEKSAIRLSELGPRLTLQLIKVEDGLMDGEVLYHELVSKTEEEVEKLRKKREQKKKLKEKRKKIQEQNKEKNEQNKVELKEKSLQGMKKANDKKTSENVTLMRRAVKEANENTQMSEDDDEEYFRQEVGEEPDKDLFTSSARKNKPFSHNFKRFKRNTNDNPKASFKGNRKNKFDKTNSANRDRRPIGGTNSKHPGGRGGNPKYGFKAQQSEKSNKFKGGKVQKKYKK